MIRRTPFLRINLQFSQIRLTEALTFIVSPLSRYADEHLLDSSCGDSDVRHNLHDRMQTPGSISTRMSTTRISTTRMSTTRMSATELSATLNRRTGKKSRQTVHRRIPVPIPPGKKQPVLPGQGEARNILIGAVNRQVASH